MKKILFILSAVVLLAASCNAASSTSSSSASSSGSLTREKAAEMILAYLKQTDPGSTQLNSGKGLIDRGEGFNCGGGLASSGVTDNLINEGYMSKAIDRSSWIPSTNFAPTAQANPYVLSPASPANYNVTTVLLAKMTNVTVTGLTNIIQNNVQAQFTATSELTPFGVACSYPSTQNGTAGLELYDDGWRVTAVGMDMTMP